MRLGETLKLKVDRISDLGYMLKDPEIISDEEVLLHFNQSDKEYKENDLVEVYLYIDGKKRITATTEKPFITTERPGWVKVVGKVTDLGIFINNNTPKDVLISKDYLPYDLNARPEMDMEIYCILKKRRDYITAKPLNKFDLADLHIVKPIYEEGDKVNGRVMRITTAGVGVFTSDLASIFVHKNFMRKNYKLGELVEVTIIKVKSNEYNGSLIEHKENMISKDSQLIIDYLKNNNGHMELTSKSSSEEIGKFFNLSRKAFKRALGSLYKDRTVQIVENVTILSETAEDELFEE